MTLTYGLQYRSEFGFVDVSWRALIVGVITSVIVLPPTALLVLLFRRAKVPYADDDVSTTSSSSCGGGGGCLGSGDSSSDSQDSTSRLLRRQPAHTASLFDQSMLNWQGLQEWAEKTWAKRCVDLSVCGGHTRTCIPFQYHVLYMYINRKKMR